MTDIRDEVRDLCGRLDPHAECRNRMDYRCVACRAGDEIERLRSRVKQLEGHLDWIGWSSAGCDDMRHVAHQLLGFVKWQEFYEYAREDIGLFVKLHKWIDPADPRVSELVKTFDMLKEAREER